MSHLIHPSKDPWCQAAPLLASAVGVHSAAVIVRPIPGPDTVTVGRVTGWLSVLVVVKAVIRVSGYSFGRVFIRHPWNRWWPPEEGITAKSVKELELLTLLRITRSIVVKPLWGFREYRLDYCLRTISWTLGEHQETCSRGCALPKASGLINFRPQAESKNPWNMKLQLLFSVKYN